MKELRVRSAARVSGDQDFAELREEITQFKKSLSTKTVSLNEAERRRENQADQNRDELRKKEHLVLGGNQPATCYITVENADKVGLPAPVATGDNLPRANSASIAEKKAIAAGSGPPSDPVLGESEHIMADYVDLPHQTPAAVLAAH